MSAKKDAMKSFQQIIAPSKKALSPNEIDVVLYHAKCPDGIAAAYAVWKAFPDKPIQYIGLHPKQNPPKDLKGGILCVDYAPKLPIVRGMMKHTKILVCDHHATNKADLETIPEINKIFDITQSACHLAWRFMHRTTPPLWLQYVEAYDLYKLQMLPHVEAFNAWFSTIIAKKKPLMELFQELDTLNDDDILSSGIELGKAYCFIVKSKLEDVADSAYIHLCKIGERYYNVVHCNCVALPAADLSSVLFRRFPMADMAVCYRIGSNSTSFSLRSTPERADVGVVAKLFGGGGHACAAGIAITGCHNRLPGEYYSDITSMVSSSCVKHNKGIVVVDYNKHKEHLARYLLQNSVSDCIIIKHYDLVNDQTHFTILINKIDNVFEATTSGRQSIDILNWNEFPSFFFAPFYGSLFCSFF